MVPKSDHLANPRFDKKPSAHPEVELPPPPPVGDRKNFHWVKLPAQKFEGSIFERLKVWIFTRLE